MAPGFTDSQEDYQLVVVVDAAAEIAESDETNNQLAFDGGVFQTSDGVVHVHGTGGADIVDIQQPGAIEITLGGVTYGYSDSSVSEIHVRTHGGADELNTSSDLSKSLWGFGGSDADRIEGGSGDDVLDGGSGDDTYVFSGSVDLGSDTITEAADLDRDTLDFSGFAQSVYLDLANTSAQTVNSGYLELTLSDAAGIEDVVGGDSGDNLYGNLSGNMQSSAAMFAQGASSTASARAAFAQGIGATANGTRGSFAQGLDVTASASGGSFAQGYKSLASGNDGSFSQGKGSTASGEFGSIAQGVNSTASGSFGSFAQGDQAIASGAEGCFSQGGFTTASADFGSFAQGQNATATGTMGSFAQGVSARATGYHGCFAQGTSVTASGDTVVAVAALGLANGLSVQCAARLANFVAGLQVRQLGATAVTRKEIESELQRNRTSRSRPSASDYPLDQLVGAVEEYRRCGKTIALTNGCFDLLHVGHIRCLEEAAQLADVLIVAVNSDASVRRLKGPSRPILGEQQRAEMLAALACVDHVAIFDEDTPQKLLGLLRPDVLVKGGGYAKDEVVGREIVEAYGGEVRVTSHVDGISTSAIVKAVRPPDDVEQETVLTAR